MSSSTTLLQTSLWMLRTANELSLSSDMVDLRYVFNLFIVEKLLSASQLDTGIVAKILNTLISSGRKLQVSFSMSNPRTSDALFPVTSTFS